MLPDLPTLAEHSAPFLIDLAARGVILFVLAALVVAAFRGAAAATRHAVWAAALSAALVLPVLVIVLPSWVVPLTSQDPGSHASYDVTVEETSAIAEAGVVDFGEAILSDAGQVPTATPEGNHQQADGAFARVSDAISSPPSLSEAWGYMVATGGRVSQMLPSGMRSPLSWLALIWLFGAALTAGRWIAAFAGANRLIGEATPIIDSRTRAIADELRDQLHIRRPIRLLESDRLAVPVAWCFGRCAVVLPSDHRDWSEDRLEVVLLHELAHIARHDGLTQIVAQMAVVLHWFNPLAWMAYRQLLQEREQACDDLVLVSGTRPSTYAEHLLDVANRFRQDSLALLAVAPMARQVELSGRIESILDPSRRRGQAHARAVAFSAIAAIALAIPLAAFTPFGTEDTNSEIAPALEPMTTTEQPAEGSSSDSSNETNRWTWEGTVAEGAYFEVYAVNGAIRVRQGEDARGSVVATPRQRRFDGARLVVNETRNGVVACVVYDGQRGCEPGSGPSGRKRNMRNDEVNVEVVLPRNVTLRARSTNGAVRTDMLDRAADVATTNGAIEVATRSGEISANTTNGSIRLRASDRASARTTNGAINATFTATRWAGTSSLRTTNGAITVELPQSANVDIEARTSTGGIRSDFGAVAVSRSRGPSSSAQGRLGTGGRNLDLRTGNGSVTIRSAGSAHGAHPDPRPAEPHHLEEAVGSFAAALTETITLSLSAASFGLESAALALKEIEGIDAVVAEAMAEIDFEEIEREVTIGIREARIDRDQIHLQVQEEVRRALEEARIELERGRRQLPDRHQ